MTNTNQTEQWTKVEKLLIKKVALHKIVGYGLYVSPRDIEPDGRKVKKALKALLDQGKIVEVKPMPGLEGPAYAATEMLYDEIIAEAPKDRWTDEHRSVAPYLRHLSIYNLKWIAEHRADYVVCFVKSPYHMLRGEYFEIVEPIEGAAWEQEKAYREFHHENPFNLEPVAVRRALLVEKKAAHRDARIREIMSYNLVDYLLKEKHIDESEREGVVRKSNKRGLGLDAPSAGLSEDPDNWENDVQGVINECIGKIAELEVRLALFKKLAKIDWAGLKVKLLRDCTRAVDEAE